MASGKAKALIGGLFGKLFFRDARVTRATELSPHFRRIEVEGEALRGVAWEPGDKVQVFFESEGMRTYTPLAWDAARGATAFLVYVHGDETPGARWGRHAREGDECRFFGPRGSVALRGLGGPIVFVGDETSYAAAHALRTAGAEGDHAYVFEATGAAESRGVLAQLGLGGAALFERAANDGHLREVLDATASALRARPGAKLVLTGKAQSIQAVRAGLKGLGLSRDGKVKAYWSVGKSGLD